MTMKSNTLPTLRLNIWLETEDGLVFGMGRAQLLEKVEELGSLRKAAKALNMSYRGAWGKIKKTEEVLGFALIEKRGGNRAGYALTEEGKAIKDDFLAWFDHMEREALSSSKDFFPWKLTPFTE